MNAITIAPNYCSREEYEELKDYLTEKCWEFKEEKEDKKIDTEPKIDYILFGSTAVRIYDEEGGEGLLEAHESGEIDEGSYSLVAFNPEINTLFDVLFESRGFDDYSRIEKELYDKLN
jgi:hypothetical protein